MIFIKESVNTFNSKFRKTQNVKDGDILSSEYLNTLPGVSASDETTLIIDNDVPYRSYVIVNEDGSEKVKNYDN